MSKSLNIALVEPYYGGSHRSFCDTVAAHSRHRIKLITLPARKWKWRMRGAAVWFTRENAAWLAADEPLDAVLCCDMVAAADLRAMLPAHRRNIPIACYFHENQLTYPLLPGEERDLQYGMTNITSCLAADAAWFNSEFHRGGFLQAAAELLGQMPDFVPRTAIRELERKCTVLRPPVSMRAQLADEEEPQRRTDDGPPIIVWCHRWEYDKNPEPFFRAILALDREGVPFRLVLLGEQFANAPAVFAAAWPQVQKHVIHAGYIDSRDDYLAMLRRCDVAISTAIQEFCGLAVIEAMMSGCQPLLPRRLSYPELIPEPLRAVCLYDCDEALLPALCEVLSGRRQLAKDGRRSLVAFLNGQFGVAEAVSKIDDALSGLVADESGANLRCPIR